MKHVLQPLIPPSSLTNLDSSPTIHHLSLTIPDSQAMIPIWQGTSPAPSVTSPPSSPTSRWLLPLEWCAKAMTGAAVDDDVVVSQREAAQTQGGPQEPREGLPEAPPLSQKSILGHARRSTIRSRTRGSLALPSSVDCDRGVLFQPWLARERPWRNASNGLSPGELK